ncbi:MAG: hypothetical protein JOS17DRAFT_816490 [Linnemannia elongata]|nr:MAG: hypothetical protein JOS17DRAFT_816490 [Linnemannia elongata]
MQTVKERKNQQADRLFLSTSTQPGQISSLVAALVLMLMFLRVHVLLGFFYSERPVSLLFLFQMKREQQVAICLILNTNHLMSITRQY